MASTNQPLRGRDQRAAEWEKRMKQEQAELYRRQREQTNR